MNYYICFYYFYFAIFTFGIFFFVLVPYIHNPLVSGEIYTSQFEVESILNLQRNVVESIEKYLTKEQLRLEKIQLSLQHLANEKSKLKRLAFGQEEIGLNPIDAYKLVKFLTTDLQMVLNSSTNSLNGAELSDEIEHLRKKYVFPTKEDLSGAALALIRLQDTYLLNASSLSSGVLNDYCCATNLTADDCFEIGQYSYYSKNYLRTIEWMNEALAKLGNEEKYNIVTSEINEPINQMTLSNSAIHTEITEYLLWATELQSITTLTEKFMTSTMGMGLNDLVNRVVAEYSDEQDKNSVVNKTKPLSYSSSKLKYEALCRGETTEETSYDAALYCSYHRNSYYTIIGPIKQEILHADPPIMMYHQVLHNEEIETIKKLSQPTFDTAQVLNYVTGGSQKSQVRIGKIAWLTEDHKVVSKVNKRISLITGLSLITAEDLQVVNYGLGGHYVPHYDYSNANQASNFMTVEEGNRIATFLIYMSNVEAGGSTVFPSLGIGVKPIKGSAIFWYNLLENGQGDTRTLHGACPVLLGQKWVSNKWIHERGQEFIRPCRSI